MLHIVLIVHSAVMPLLIPRLRGTAPQGGDPGLVGGEMKRYRYRCSHSAGGELGTLFSKLVNTDVQRHRITTCPVWLSEIRNILIPLCLSMFTQTN